VSLLEHSRQWKNTQYHADTVVVHDAILKASSQPVVKRVTTAVNKITLQKYVKAQ
jgi:hypothetical protein